MSNSIVFSFYLQPSKIHSLLNLLLVFLLLPLPHANSFSFNFSDFPPNMPNASIEPDAFARYGVLELTKDRSDGDIHKSVGRFSYDNPVRLYDDRTGRLTDFTTHFSFVITSVTKGNNGETGDGLSFFMIPFVPSLSPPESQIPENSSGGCLGLINQKFALNDSANQFVAVEFDTFKNGWDPSDSHFGINVNSMKSRAVLNLSSNMANGSTANAWVSYNSANQNLSVFLSYSNNTVFRGNSTLSYIIDLRKVLPDLVRVGFSASTGLYVELHTIRFWSFNSTLEVEDANRTVTQNGNGTKPDEGNGTKPDEGNGTKPDKGNKKIKLGLKIGLPVGFGILSCGSGLLLFIYWRRKANWKMQDFGGDICMNDEFEKGTGPRRFTYRELIRATNNFGEERKLGEGGFGGVYRGLLSESDTEVAVKRVSKGSKQGKKEYISEVKIISQLRHRNLVQLIGWCHEHNEFLLVYEYMPNKSLDSHLFRGQTILTWPLRHKIAIGLASALLYLHEEWEQCVVHRDIKSSNVMLDANFNAKLGDFGLARLADHELGLQTTVLAGTLGYLAPECATIGKASKESDVYSFGVVCLEIACGRKPVELRAEPSKVRLVEWVWELYGTGHLLEAVDQRLNGEFNERQTECLLTVGLWCSHPDPTFRPSIRQVINVLNFEAPLPNLPSKFPVPMYFSPPMDMCGFSNTSSGLTGSTKDHTHHSCSTCTTHSSMSEGVEKALLNSDKSLV